MYAFYYDDVGADNADDGHAKIIRGRPHRLVAMARWQSFCIICMAIMMMVIMLVIWW